MIPMEPHDDDEISMAPAIDTSHLCQLIRSAVAMTEAAPVEVSLSKLPAASEQVVFDIDVDGARYILLRTVQIGRTMASLSPREREIVRMVALGHQNKVIAGVLNISSWTVCTHMRRIFTKLGVSSRAAMVAKVSDLGTCIQPIQLPAWRPGSVDRRSSAGSVAPANRVVAKVTRKDVTTV